VWKKPLHECTSGFVLEYCQFSEDCWWLSGRMIGSYPFGKDLEGSDHGLIEALSRNLWRE
jgi:hypothetical protein